MYLLQARLMGCQKEIARKIIHASGDYLLAIKGHQPSLHEAIFSDERQAELLKRPHRQVAAVGDAMRSVTPDDDRRFFSGCGDAGTH